MRCFAGLWPRLPPACRSAGPFCERPRSVKNMLMSTPIQSDHRRPPSMVGERDVKKLLATMRPSLSETMFAFASVPDSRDIPAKTTVVGTFVEDEGLTIIGPLEEFAWAGLDHSEACAKISLTVHSSLSAVGLTALVSSALADHRISANVVAGFFHDHIFVPWDKRHLAMEVLTGLSGN